jgi:hypothetical protein
MRIKNYLLALLLIFFKSWFEWYSLIIQMNLSKSINILHLRLRLWLLRTSNHWIFGISLCISRNSSNLNFISVPWLRFNSHEINLLLDLRGNCILILMCGNLMMNVVTVARNSNSWTCRNLSWSTNTCGSLMVSCHSSGCWTTSILADSSSHWMNSWCLWSSSGLKLLSWTRFTWTDDWWDNSCSSS